MLIVVAEDGDWSRRWDEKDEMSVDLEKSGAGGDRAAI